MYIFYDWCDKLRKRIWIQECCGCGEVIDAWEQGVYCDECRMKISSKNNANDKLEEVK